MLLTALLVFLVAMCLKTSNYFFPNMQFDRPIIVGFVIGLVLGDVKTGILIGAQLELVFLGVMAIGSSQAADPLTATAIAVSFSILNGLSVSAAVALGVALGYVALAFWAAEPAVAELFNPLIDRYIKRDEFNKYRIAIWVGGTVSIMITPLVVFLAVSFGGDLVNGLMNAMPAYILAGINAAGAMLPAVGLAMMLQLLWNWKAAIYFILGFMLIAYLKVDTVFLLVIATFIALVGYFGSADNKGGSQPAKLSEEEEFLK